MCVCVLCVCSGLISVLRKKERKTQLSPVGEFINFWRRRTSGLVLLSVVDVVVVRNGRRAGQIVCFGGVGLFLQCTHLSPMKEEQEEEAEAADEGPKHCNQRKISSTLRLASKIIFITSGNRRMMVLN